MVTDFKVFSIVNKSIVTLYSLFCIFFTGLTYVYRVIIITLWNAYNYVTSAIPWIHRERHRMKLKHHFVISAIFIMCILFLKWGPNTNYYLNCFVNILLTISLILFLIETSISWEFIHFDWVDERYNYHEDYSIFRDIILSSFIMIPLFFGALFATSFWSPILVILYLVMRFGYIDLFESTAHDCMHKPILVTQKTDRRHERLFIRFMYYYFNYIYNTIFLFPPNLYYHHHIYNHHPENCGDKDVSSPIRYHRQSVTDFCRCTLKLVFNWFTGLDLLIYLIKKKKRKAVKSLVFGLSFFYGLVYLISYISPLLSVMMVIQRVIDGFFFAVTIWRWHAFIDPNEPQNAFKNSTNISFEDSYIYAFHALHHLKPSMHYEDMEKYIKVHSEIISKSNMIVLNNIRLAEIVTLILADRLDIVARYRRDVTNTPLESGSFIDLLKSRVLPSPNSKLTRCFMQTKIDTILRDLLRFWNRELFDNMISNSK